jgi:spore maturation protein SpmA
MNKLNTFVSKEGIMFVILNIIGITLLPMSFVYSIIFGVTYKILASFSIMAIHFTVVNIVPIGILIYKEDRINLGKHLKYLAITYGVYTILFYIFLRLL